MLRKCRVPNINVLLTVHYSTVYQNSESNVMHFLFSLLRIKRLYMFPVLLVYPQEALHKRHLVYCVRVMPVGFYQDWSGTDSTPIHACNIPTVVCEAFLRMSKQRLKYIEALNS
jgi:hypothetical protein